jgi:multicomponent Na+:H+ antiporter subunit G
VTPTEVAAAVLVAGGVFFAFVGVVGLVRLPDVYTRTHSASKSDTLGAGLALAAVAVTFGADLPSVKAALLLVFMFVTNPTAAHAITRAAADQGIEPWTVDDETDGGGGE